MQIRTFADAGRWHAVVPAVGSVQSQRARARKAIACAVRVRERDPKPPVRLADTPPVVAQGRRSAAVRVWRER